MSVTSELTAIQRTAQRVMDSHEAVEGYYTDPGSQYACSAHPDSDGDLCLAFPCDEVVLAAHILGQPVPEAQFVPGEDEDEDEPREEDYKNDEYHVTVPVVDWEPTRENLDALIAEMPKTLLPSDRVAFGATFLDRHRPGWALAIDPEYFRISSASACVFGMLDEGYERGARKMFDSHPDSYAVAQALGFDYVRPESAALLLGVVLPKIDFDATEDELHVLTSMRYELGEKIAQQLGTHHNDYGQYDALQEAWMREVATRQAAANSAQSAAEGAAESVSAQTEMQDESARLI